MMSQIKRFMLCWLMLAFGAALTGAGSRGSPTFPPTDQLTCNGIIKVSIDAGSYVILKKLAIHGDAITAWIDFGFSEDALKRSPRKFSNGATVAYRLDTTPLIALRQFSNATSAEVALTFYHLPKGPHRLSIGIADANGSFVESRNDYCFNVPAHFSL